MNLRKRLNEAFHVRWAILVAGLLYLSTALLLSSSASAQVPGDQSRPAPVCAPAKLGSPYIPVDSWVYPAMLRLYSLGYINDMFLGLRPWTRANVEHMLEEASSDIQDAQDDNEPAAGEANSIYEAVDQFLNADSSGPCLAHEGHTRIETVYSRFRGLTGTPLHDSFHVGSTIVNDYGRPFESGFNNYSGASGFATAGRFAFYVRGEFQGAPSATGYSPAVAQTLSAVDQLLYINPATNLPYNQPTIPAGPISSAAYGRFLEAYVSGQVLNHVISFGKHDQWLSPAQGGSMAFSNNAQNFYAFEINRIEPLRVPLLSCLTGPFRYEFLVGALRGHNFMPNSDYVAHPSPNIPNVTAPGDPWVHVEKLSFRPLPDLEFGFERTILWGGEGHSPVNVKDFLRSFFSTVAGNCPDSLTAPPGTLNNKCGPRDPGARFGSFDFSWRLPYLRKWVTLYSDSEVHDDISPIDAPRRSAYRPGIYLSHFPGVPKLDLRVEAASTDPASATGQQYGHFMYWETIEKQGYTNQGQLFGDWIGREDKGGQAWLTWHLSGNEWIQTRARNQKAENDFIPGGTTQDYIGSPGTVCSASNPCYPPGGTTLNDFGFQVVKRIGKDIEINGNFTVEHWTVPLIATGQQTVTNTDIQITWFPSRKVSF
jgi:hypothetical protein